MTQAALILAIKAHDAAGVRAILAESPAARDAVNRGTDDLGFGATPLIGAVQRKDRDVIDALLEAGADITRKSDWWAGGFSVLDHASEELVPFLLERGAVLEPCSAAKFGMVDRLEEMIVADPGAVHARGGDGKTPLHWARDVATARVLIEHGADIDARDVDHESTPIQYQIGDHLDVARFLVSRGAKVDIFAAAAVGDLDLVRRIVDTDPTSLEMVVDGTSFPMKNPRAGGPIYIWTLGQGKSPHTVAWEHGHRNIFDFLMERSSPEVRLAQACLSGDDALFEREFSTHAEVAGNLSPRMVQQIVGAASNNNTAAVRLMLRAGWSADTHGPHGGTPLHWSAWHGNVEMMRELLRHHAPLDVRDQVHHGTPLGWALHGSLYGWHAKDGDYSGVVTALLDAGAAFDGLPAEVEGSDAALAALERGRARRLDMAQ